MRKAIRVNSFDLNMALVLLEAAQKCKFFESLDKENASSIINFTNCSKTVIETLQNLLAERK